MEVPRTEIQDTQRLDMALALEVLGVEALAKAARRRLELHLMDEAVRTGERIDDAEIMLLALAQESVIAA